MLDAEAVQNIVGSHFCQQTFDEAATNGKITRTQLDELIAAARTKEQRKFSLSEKNLAAHTASFSQKGKTKASIVPALAIESISAPVLQQLPKKVNNKPNQIESTDQKKEKKEKKPKEERKSSVSKGHKSSNNADKKNRRRRKNSTQRKNSAQKAKAKKKPTLERTYYAIGQHVEVNEDLDVALFHERGTAITKDEMITGVYHFEVEIIEIGSVAGVGVCDINPKLDVYPGDDKLSWGIWSDGDLVSEGEPSNHHEQWHDGDKIRLRFDADNECFEWWRNTTKGKTVRGITVGEDGVCFCVGGRRGTEFKLVQPEPERQEQEEEELTEEERKKMKMEARRASQDEKNASLDLRRNSVEARMKNLDKGDKDTDDKDKVATREDLNSGPPPTKSLLLRREGSGASGTSQS